MSDEERRLLTLMIADASAVYDVTYATLERCTTCNRALADVDCERELELPANLRMCFARQEGGDETCEAGLRPE